MHFVLPIRVNNEDLDDSRKVFYEELKERVKGLSLYDAVLEVNLSHPALRKLNSARKSDPKRAVSYAVILYNQARMMAGLPIKDPVTYTDLLTDLFTE